MIRFVLGLLVLLAAWHVLVLRDWITGTIALGVLALLLGNYATIRDQFSEALNFPPKGTTKHAS